MGEADQDIGSSRGNIEAGSRADAVELAARAIIALINSRPRTPTELEIRAALRDCVLLSADAAHTQTMEQVAQVMTGLAHEVHTLLTVIAGHAAIIRKRIADERR